MHLPRIMMITGDTPRDPRQCVKKIMVQVTRGIRLIQLRAKYLSKADYIALAEEILELTKNHEVTLILNCELSWFHAVNAQGIHLTSESLMNLDKRPLSRDSIVFSACHNREQLEKANEIGVDFVTLSPVLPTQTHPDAPALGWEAFSRLSHATKIPIYALGGLMPEHLTQAVSLGAYGIAAVNALWESLGS